MRIAVVFLLVVPSIAQAQCKTGTCWATSPPSMQNLSHCSVSREQMMSRQQVTKYQQDLVYMQQQYKQFSSLSDNMIEKGMRSQDKRTKFSAMLVAGDKKLPLQTMYYQSVTDPDAMIRQAARRNLILMSAVRLNPEKEYTSLAKKNKLKFVDFGPPPCCTEQEAAASLELWQAWFSESPGQKLDSATQKP